MPEQTFCMIKPDATARELTQEIKSRIEGSGLKIVKDKDLTMSRSQAEKLYSGHKGKDFYDGLVDFITSGPVTVMMLEGDNAILRLRQLMGETDPRKAAPGTIRGDLREDNIFTEKGTMKNLVHGSDSPDSAKNETAIFF